MSVKIANVLLFYLLYFIYMKNEYDPWPMLHNTDNRIIYRAY